MGRRDFRHHEHKKKKRGQAKSTISEIIQTTQPVEIVKKKGKKEPEIEEQ
jgi:hypothetical protein